MRRPEMHFGDSFEGELQVESGDMTIPEAVEKLRKIYQLLAQYGNDGGETKHVAALMSQVEKEQKNPAAAVKEAMQIYNSKNEV